MGNEIAKRYSYDAKPTASGGHGYQWRMHQATRKKDGLECSVFVFQKSELEKKLRGQTSQSSLSSRIMDVMRRDAAVLGELSGMMEEREPKVAASTIAEPRTMTAFVKAATAATSAAMKATEAMAGGIESVKVAKGRAPRGVLQLHEMVESRAALVLVTERVVCSLGNAMHRLWCGVDADDVPRSLLSVDFSSAEVLRGAASICEALEALRAGSTKQRRWVHLGVVPESIWLTKSGDWRLAGFGLAQVVEDGRFDAASPFFDSENRDTWNGSQGAEVALLTAMPRLQYSAPELTAENNRGGRRVTTAADVFSLGAVLYEALGRCDASVDFPALLDGCGDSLYKHRSLVQQKLAANLVLHMMPSVARDALQRSLQLAAEHRPDATTLRGSPAFHTSLVRVLRELDSLGARDPAQASTFLAHLTSLVEGEIADRLVTCVVVPGLDVALKERPSLIPHAIPCVLACARRVEPSDFRRLLQPLLEISLQTDKMVKNKKLSPEQRHILGTILNAAPVILEKGDASWASKCLMQAFDSALQESAGPALNDAALLQLGSGDCLDALYAKASMSRLHHELADITKIMLPPACRVAEDPQMQLSTRIRALKAIAAFVERPTATPIDHLTKTILPVLNNCVRRVDGEPAAAMCLLGCYDAVVSRLPERSRLIASEVLPSLIPLLDERSLNARQFEMVASRINTLLAAACKARRAELTIDGGSSPGASLQAPSRAPATQQQLPAASLQMAASRSTSEESLETSWNASRIDRAPSPSDPFSLSSASSPMAPRPPAAMPPRPQAAMGAAPRRTSVTAPRQVSAAEKQKAANDAEIARLKHQLSQPHSQPQPARSIDDELERTRKQVASLQTQLSGPGEMFGGLGSQQTGFQQQQYSGSSYTAQPMSGLGGDPFGMQQQQQQRPQQQQQQQQQHQQQHLQQQQQPSGMQQNQQQHQQQPFGMQHQQQQPFGMLPNQGMMMNQQPPPPPPPQNNSNNQAMSSSSSSSAFDFMR